MLKLCRALLKLKVGFCQMRCEKPTQCTQIFAGNDTKRIKKVPQMDPYICFLLKKKVSVL